jgi:ribosome-associated translation inhibitor RaiA
MQTPLQLTFRSSAGHSPALAEHLKMRAERLDEIYDRIISCQVVVELAGHHHQHGDRFHFSIHVCVSGHEIIVNHAPVAHREPRNAYESADLAFDDAERQLEDWVGRQRDKCRKPHSASLGEKGFENLKRAQKAEG